MKQYDETLPSKSPFMWIEQETSIPDSTLMQNICVLSYGTYSACALTGPEMGGVAIVHNYPNYIIATRKVLYMDERIGIHEAVVKILTTEDSVSMIIKQLNAIGGFDMRFTDGRTTHADQ